VKEPATIRIETMTEEIETREDEEIHKAGNLEEEVVLQGCL
jgi:hypothetical protein